METKSAEILIVDDNPENLRVLDSILSNEGYSVRVARDGQQAIASIELAEPDLVLLDVNMPVMNGIEVCKTVKKNEKYENLPIIFLSALDDSFNRGQGLKAGAVDYMTKPFDVDEVKVRIKTHLQLRECLLEIERLEHELAEKEKKIKKLKATTDK